MKPSAEYFLGYAYGWLSSRREADLARQIKTDVHSPAQYRVNGPLRNIDAFYDAFLVKEGQMMFVPKDQRVQIW
jgi:putative endopeptidase